MTRLFRPKQVKPARRVVRLSPEAGLAQNRSLVPAPSLRDGFGRGHHRFRGEEA